MYDMIDFQSKVFLFIASFSPMWFILIDSYLIDDHSASAIVISFLIILRIITSIIISCHMFSKYRNSTNAEPVVLKSIKDITHKHTGQLIAYVFFALIDVTSNHNIFVIISLAFFVCIIFSRTNIILTNPAFLAVGFKIYEANVTLPYRTITLLSNSFIKNGDSIYIKEIAPIIFIDKVK